MTKPNNGGPAFPFFCQGPTTAPEIYYGLSMRDYFAAKAMQGMLANPQQDYAPLTTRSQEAVVSGAYEMADAMLKAREAA